MIESTDDPNKYMVNFEFEENLSGKPLCTIYFDINSDEELLKEMNLLDKVVIAIYTLFLNKSQFFY